MGKNEIKLNKKMRMWNKYKNLVYVCVGVVAAVVVCIAAYKGITGSSDNTDKKSAAQTTVAGNNTTQSTQSQNITQQTTMQNTTVAGNAAQTTIAGNTQQTTMANAAQAAGVTPLTLAGPAQAQEYTSRDYYNGSIFIGDSIIDGIAYYKIYADGNNTTDKTEKYLDDIIKLTPARVFIMVGLNDANYGTRSAQTIAENIMAIASQIKTASPNTNVCVLSLLPITQEFEAKANVNAKQSMIDEINNIVMAACPSNSVTYVDVATAFKDASGYMNPQYTGNGSNIYNEYYPFLLNGIAGVVK